MKTKLSKILFNVANWQPRPYCEYTSYGPISWWFFSKQGYSHQRNWLGKVWLVFWMALAEWLSDGTKV